MNHTYRTNFYLEAPVNDIGEAEAYLQEDEMVRYYLSNNPEMRGVVTSIVWNLVGDDSGYVEVEATRELSDEELLGLSHFISGQNSDGLGEGFEQNFMYHDEDDGEDYMCSFDWANNPYMLTEVEP